MPLPISLPSAPFMFDICSSNIFKKIRIKISLILKRYAISIRVIFLLVDNDNNPSFVVDTNKNRWIDFSTGDRGSILDLYMALFNEDIKVGFVLKRLAKIFSRVLSPMTFSTNPIGKLKSKSKIKPLVLHAVSILSDKILLSYLKFNRKIDLYIAQKIL